MSITIKDLLCVDHFAFYNIEALKTKSFAGVSTDSRSVKPDELFFAIRGEKFDGHTFLKDVFQVGALCAIVDQRADVTTLMGKPLLIVKDTTKALGQLANIYRKKFDIPIIAIAGSNGKTTTKEMIASVLDTKYSVLSTQGNLNNHIGMPQTLFRLKHKHQIAVIEIGTNHFGELRYLCEISNPTHGLITNIGREHLEFFRSIKGAAKAEGELFQWLNGEGFGFVNADDPSVIEQAKLLREKISYGCINQNSKIQGKLLNVNDNGCAEFAVRTRNKKEFNVQLTVPGRYAMNNGLAAAAVGLQFGVPPKNIQRALNTFRGMGKRMEVKKVRNIIILNDTYNSNPDSVLSALETLKSMKCDGNKIVILADMLELGTASKKEHEHIGVIINKMGFEYLLTYGEKARCIYEKAKVKVKAHYDQQNILSEYAAELISDGDIVLVKGSRGMKMEYVVAFLEERFSKKAV